MVIISQFIFINSHIVIAWFDANLVIRCCWNSGMQSMLLLLNTVYGDTIVAILRENPRCDVLIGFKGNE